jgi:A/G-specific adenine glycosylase
LRKRDSVGRNRAVAGGSSPIDAGVGPPDSPDGGRGVALDHDTAWVAGVRERLAAWYAQAARDLPWRADRDPYRILVSELMLIQTTVAAVIPYFERFIGRYPSVAALAAADLAEVLKAWEGLGYYRRARQLHATARAIVCNHGGTIPQDPAAVRALPGVGRYIAGAILSFAFDQPEPIVEANSQRVLARLLALRQNLKTAPARERLWQAAERLVPAANAGVFNQALMELGALVCTPREPACLFCPVASFCEARRLGLQDRLPETTPKPRPQQVTEAAAVVVRRGQVLIVQRGLGRLWEQFWEFPTIHKEGVDPAGRSLRAADDTVEAVKQLTGITIQVGPPVKTIVYSVTNHRVKLIVHLGKALRGNPRPGPGLVEVRWVEPRDLVEYTFSSAGRRLIGWINQNLDAVMAGL